MINGGLAVRTQIAVLDNSRNHLLGPEVWVGEPWNLGRICPRGRRIWIGGGLPFCARFENLCRHRPRLGTRLAVNIHALWCSRYCNDDGVFGLGKRSAADQGQHSASEYPDDQKLRHYVLLLSQITF